MTGGGPHGPPDDPSDRPTRMASYGVEDARPPDSAGYPGYSQAAEPESPPDPWYRNRWLLAAWATMVAILIGLIIYGLIQLSHGGGGGSSTTTPSTTPNRSSTPTRSSTSTTPPSTTTTPPEPSSTTEEQEPSDDNSPPAGEPPAPEEPPRHHHHLPHIPSTITLPHTVITLPPGL